MIFWTVVFFTFSLVLLIKGNVFYDSLIKIGEAQIKQYENPNNFLIKKETETEILKSIPLLSLCLIMIIGQCIYYVYAINIDIYKYPTIFILLYLILNLIIGYKPSVKVEEIGIEKYRKYLYNIKKYSFKILISQLMYVIYFIYMFYILVF